MSRIKSLFFVFVLAAKVPLASATVTYVVGTCQKTIYTSIQAALDATPSPDLVKVCPGTYKEQIIIGTPLTLEGISDGTSTGAIIAVPSGGLKVNATDDLGDPVAAQVLVENVVGEVNLSNLTVDGTGPGLGGTAVFYQNSSGAVSHLSVTTTSIGIWLEGGTANPSVTVENNNLQGISGIGILAEAEAAPAPTTELTATVKGNYLVVPSPSVSPGPGIDFEYGVTGSITGNLLTGGFEGIGWSASEGSISKNTVVGATYGIELDTSASVTSNTLFDSANTGIIGVPTSVALTGNAITQSGTAIDFNCIPGSVHSNTILGTSNGLVRVPSGVLTPNMYYNVGTIKSGGC